MGAYLNKPNKDKLSEDGSLGRLKYGASSMQGWRISQEDAHNCCLDFDKDTSLFAVYDGHGGSEVADYAALKLPDFIKEMPVYKDGNIAQALEDSFLQFDATLVKEDVIELLREMAGVNIDEDDEADDEEAEKLNEEADMPMEELMKRYGYLKQGEEDGEVHSIRSVSKKGAMHSPAIRAKKSVTKTDCDTDVCVKLEDQLVNGHSGKTALVPAPDSTDSSEVKPSEITNGSTSSKVDNSHSVPDPCISSSESGDVVGSTGSENSEDTHVSSSTPVGIAVASSAEEPAGGSSSVCSDQQAGDEPCSSSGRTKVKKTGIIPKEGEDESSFDEDEEDTEEEDSDEEAEPWKSGPDDEEDSEDDALGSFIEEEDDDDDEEEQEVMTGGEEPGRDSGCTAVVAILHKSQLYVANAGDSRCVLCRSGKAIDLSVDHKPEDDIERNRIEKAGGRITKDGRVNGGLNLSRAIGDHCYKQNTSVSDKEQMITALPDIRTVTLEDNDEFMVLACDGIWNVMSSQDVVTFVRDRLNSGSDKLSSICEEMFDLCLAPDTSGDGTGCDNMTCIIVTFSDHFPGLNKPDDSEAKPATQKDSELSSEAQASESCTEGEAQPTSIHSKCGETENQPSHSDSASKRKADDNSVDSSNAKKSKFEGET